MKRSFKIITAVLITLSIMAPAAISLAQVTNSSNSSNSAPPPAPTSYTLLAPIEINGVNTSNVAVNGSGIEEYVYNILGVIYGLATVLAIIMIIIGGIQYMSTDAISDKHEGKRKINDALWGLLLILCSSVILITINPKLVQLNLLFGDIGSAPTPVVPATPANTSGTSGTNTPSPTTGTFNLQAASVDTPTQFTNFNSGITQAECQADMASVQPNNPQLIYRCVSQ